MCDLTCVCSLHTVSIINTLCGRKNMHVSFLCTYIIYISSPRTTKVIITLIRRHMHNSYYALVLKICLTFSFSRYFLHNTTPSHRHGIFCLILNHRSLHMHHNLFLTVSFTYTHHNFLTTSPFFFSQLSHTNNFTKVDTFWPCKPALQPEATHYLFILQ